LDDRGIGKRFPAKAGPGAYIASYPKGIRGGKKGQKREADHSPPYNVEVKNTWIIPPLLINPH
jgi:hypothetical protein